LANVKLIQEKKLLSKYYEEISQDSGKYCFGVADTLYALDSGAVETLIVWENLEITRYEVKNPSTGVSKVLHLRKEEEKKKEKFSEEGVDLEVVDSSPLLEWFAENYKKFGAQLEFITDKSQEGHQFCQGFGGIGGLLRYKLDMNATELDLDDDDDDIEDYF